MNNSRKIIVFCLAFFLFLICVFMTDKYQASAVTDPTTQPLLQSNNLIYVGAFRLPVVPYGGGHGATYSFDYAAAGVAFNPANNSLFINNHIYEQKTAEISIPEIKSSTTLNGLAQSVFLQDFSDISEGNLSRINPSGTQYAGTTRMGGLLVHNNKLVGTSYAYYDGGVTTDLSHFTSGLNLSNIGDFKGMFKVGKLNPGFYGGYMTAVPMEWQSDFGASALTGQCCIAIISRTSFGPALFAFNPDDLGVKNPVPVAPLVYYPSGYPTLGNWSGTDVNLYYNMSTSVNGVVFPSGTRAVLFMGTQGTGTPCYGPGTADQSLVGTLAAGFNEPYCYDPSNLGKGSHAYPYKYWVWAYDANDLLSVKNSSKNPWDIRPYAVWPLDLPIVGGAGIQGVAYDPSTQRIYVSVLGGEQLYPDEAGLYNQISLIHVFQVNNATPVLPASTPSATPSPTPIVNSTFTPTLISNVIPTSTHIPMIHSGITNITSRIKLIRATDSPRVYYITEKGFKRWIPTAAIFLSYGNHWSDIAIIDQSQVNTIPDSNLIRLSGNPRVYKIENGKKRWITSVVAFTRYGFSWDQIAPVNQAEFNYYPLGATME